jgi:hypothetical protein
MVLLRGNVHGVLCKGPGSPANESAKCAMENASRGARGLSRIPDPAALIGMASNCSSQTIQHPCSLGSLASVNIFHRGAQIREMPLRGTLQDHIACSLENLRF